MNESFLYAQIAGTIRRDILEGRLKPGERLPSVRQLCEQWNCTPGTIQRAYNELAREGLLISRAGRGTQVAGIIPQAKAQVDGIFRRANLVHHAEAFLLESLTAGYELNEIQQALDLAMDRWRSLQSTPEAPSAGVLRFSGSHDMLLNELAHTFFGRATNDVILQLLYVGSLGGLMSLAEGKTDLAGCHLWDAESNDYNLPFVRRLLPGKAVTIVTLAHRRQGLIVAAGNPLRIHSLADLAGPGVRFINRQSGSGTRVWLDHRLQQLHIPPGRIHGYALECSNHSDVARAVAEGNVDVGLGLESAALAYGLDFVFLNRERYDLVMLAETAQHQPVQDLLAWLASPEGKQFVNRHPGYESEATGQALSCDPM